MNILHVILFCIFANDKEERHSGQSLIIVKETISVKFSIFLTGLKILISKVHFIRFIDDTPCEKQIRKFDVRSQLHRPIKFT